MTPSPPVFFPEDLIGEIFSVLLVKSLLRFRCLSNSCNTLISDPAFVKLHLKKSTTRNPPHFLLLTNHSIEIKVESPYGSDDESDVDFGVIPYSICNLLENPSFILSVDSCNLLNEKECSVVVGSCNGLICLSGHSFDRYQEYWLRLWNPATRTTSPIFGNIREKHNSIDVVPFYFDGYYKFAFGYDNSTDTYKAVASRYNKHQLRSNVRILSFGDNVWRDIDSFPVDPILLNDDYGFDEYCGVYFKSTINWLAIQNEFYYIDVKDISVEQFVIVSLDLRTETFNQYLMPRDFDEVPYVVPSLRLLGDSLCFSYCYKETYFVIWQMKEFGVEDCWTQLLKFNFHNLGIGYDRSDRFVKYNFKLVPVLLSEDGDTLILYYSSEYQTILYNWKNNSVRRTEITASRTTTDDRTVDSVRCTSMDYVESLISVF